MIEELTKELHSKEALITELASEKTSLTVRLRELEGQVQELSSSLLQKDKDVEVCMPHNPVHTESKKQQIHTLFHTYSYSQDHEQ